MKFKLSHCQLTALHNVFRSLFAIEEFLDLSNIEARLLMAVLLGIYRNISKRLIDATVTKKKHSLSFTVVEACAFWIYFTKFHVFSEENLYEANLIDQINATLHQQLTSNQFLKF
jgi:hypothetical protein